MNEEHKEPVLESLHHNSKLLAGQVAEQIALLIAKRKLEAGDKLPNEFEMARQLNVGRGTIREAVKILISRNVIEIRRGCGTFVKDKPGIAEDPFGFAFVEDKVKLALDLCELRMMIEPEIVALAAVRATDEEIDQIEEAAKAVALRYENGQLHTDKDIEFHELIAKSTKNQVMPNLIPVIQSAVAIFINVTDSALRQETIRTHQMIVDALKNRDPQKAREAMIEHLKNNQEKIKKIAGQL